YVASRSNGMIADGPTYSIAESEKFLIHWTISIAPTIGNSWEPTKHKCDLSGGIDQSGTNNSSIGSDFISRKPDTGKPFSGLQIRTTIKELIIDAAAQFFDEAIGKNPRVRQ